MFVRLMSDLHLEFSPLEVPEMPEDKDTVLVLAGDVGVGKKKRTYVDFLLEMSKRFAYVVYVPGNHEFYKGNVDTTWTKMKLNMVEALYSQSLKNVKMLNGDVLKLGEYAFIGATLWTDYNRKNPMSMVLARQGLSDHYLIRKGEEYSTFKPEDAFALHCRHKNFIFGMLDILRDKYKTVVVTHHAPSFMSVDEKFHGNNLNPSYASELGNEIADFGPDVWIHGHMHDSKDYTIGNTRVLLNPRGYTISGEQENKNFDPYLRIEI